MKLIRHLTWRNMIKSRSRTLVTVLGIILSAAMFTAVATMGVSLRSYLIDTELASSGDFFIQYDYGTMEDLKGLQQEKSVSKLGTVKTLGYTTFQQDTLYGPQEETVIIGAGNPEFFEMVPLNVRDGRLPQNSSEIIITQNVYESLKESGLPCQIGAPLKLDAFMDYEDTRVDLPTSEHRWEKTYTIVGITDYYQFLNDHTLYLSSILTVDDGSQTPLWSRFYAKTNPPKAALDLETRAYGLSWSVNQNLLNLYGASKYETLNDVIMHFGAALMLIILVGSVSLIYNAFSISVSERTKQFGLLSSVGATRKQIRRSVFTEALYLSAAGIPLGIFFGYAGIAVTLHLTHGLLEEVMVRGEEYGIRIRAVPSFPAFAVAGVVALVSVLISAWIPARRATRITPISAIRQNEEYKIPRRGIRAGKLSQKLFGIPAALARKYYTVNRRKYRATVISLTISMVLFVSASSFVQQLNTAAMQNSNVENFDFSIYIHSPEQIERIRSHPAVKRSVQIEHEVYHTFIPEDAYTDGYRNAWNEINSNDNRLNITDKSLDVYFLEDDVFRDYLSKHHIDPGPYFDAEMPTALIPDAQLTLYTRDESGREDRIRYTEPVLRGAVDSVQLMPGILPTEITDQLIPQGSSYHMDRKMEDGMLIHTLSLEEYDEEDATYRTTEFHVAVVPGQQEGVWEYHLKDPETGAIAPEVMTTETLPIPEICIGAAVTETPFGVDRPENPGRITLVLPMSAMKTEPVMPEMAVSVSDYNSFCEFVKTEEYQYMDYLESQMWYRNYITMIQVFSYGFIVLISLICICNVFNTISTNIALRRKDFGMLRSVGMKNREINRMMAFECMQYGLKSLLWGIPLSVAVSFLIGQIGSLRYDAAFSVPVSAIVIAASCIFLTVFITMLYAVSRLKKQNPIEAIRCDC